MRHWGTAEDWTAIGTMLLFFATVVGALFLLLELNRGRIENKQASRQSEEANLRTKKQATVSFYADTLERLSEWEIVLPPDRDGAGVNLFLKLLNDKENNSERQKIEAVVRSYLGFWELAATAVKHGVFDVDLFKDLSEGHLIALVDNWEPFIKSTREEITAAGGDGSRLYIELETLASKWRV